MNRILKETWSGEFLLSMAAIRNHMDPKIVAQFKQYNEELNNACQRTAEDFTLAQWLGLFDIDNYAIENKLRNMSLNDDQEKGQMSDSG